jgi:hypothetical protein
MFIKWLFYVNFDEIALNVKKLVPRIQNVMEYC